MTATARAIFTGTIQSKETLQNHGDSPYIRMAIPENVGRGEQKRTIWHNFTFWNKQALFADANYHKGTIVTVTCSITKSKGYTNFKVLESTPIANFGPAEKMRKPNQTTEPAPEQPAEDPAPTKEEPKPKLTARPKTTRKRNTRRKPAA